MARSLVESMTGDFEPDQYHDKYREALQAVIDAKVEGREIVEPEEAQPAAGNVVDLMSALPASVEAAKKGRSEPSAAKEPAKAAESAKKTPAKKAAKKPAKSPAKKAPAKKTATAKKTAKKTARKSA